MEPTSRTTPQRPRPAGILIAPLFAVFLAVSLGAAPDSRAAGQNQDEIAREVYELVLEARAKTAAGPLERRSSLDAVARRRAEYVAGLPHDKRLSVKEPITDLLNAQGIRLYRRSSLHLDMQRGYTYPASAFYESWKRYEQGWARALDPTFDGVGIGTARGEDGWLILAAVLIQDEPVPRDLPEFQRRIVKAVNEVRVERGLAALAIYQPLVPVALAHSEDMASRDYFAHRSPEGRLARSRIDEGGIRTNASAENLFKCRGVDDPLRSAVDGWMSSKGHRENILNGDFTHTGVGVAVADDGTIYFTQLFATAPY